MQNETVDTTVPQEQCCTYKRDLLQNNEFRKTLEFTPRVIICKKLQRCSTYNQMITVTNLGNQSRRLTFHTDSERDTKLIVHGNSTQSELLPENSLTVDVYIEPNEPKNINRRRHIYVMAEHPNIIFEIPIIVLDKKTSAYVPNTIKFQECPPTEIYYEFAIYNSTPNPLKFTAIWRHTGLSVQPAASTIPKNDYCPILLKLCPHDLNDLDINLTFKFSRIGESREIQLLYKPIAIGVRLSVHHLHFDEIQFGLESIQTLRVCNESPYPVNYKWQTSMAEGDALDKNELSKFIKICPMSGNLKKRSSVMSVFKFCPPATFECEDENKDPPFEFKAIAELIIAEAPNITASRVTISGLICGPEICLNVEQIDMGQIYLGEKHYKCIDVVNSGRIPGTIHFKEYSSPDDAKITIFPETGCVLQPNAKDSFKLKFYSCSVGGFLIKVQFKIKSGRHLVVVVRGTSKPVKVKIYPEACVFGLIPICIPQKEYVLLVNPLSVAIMIQCEVANDGFEDPLTLIVPEACVNKLPLNVKNPHIADDHDDMLSEHENQLNTPTSAGSVCSLGFQENILDDINALAKELLSTLKMEKSHEQSEAEVKTVGSVMDCLFSKSYFREMKENSNYMLMDWTALPSDAREVIIEKEVFYLRPNESKSLPIMVIPNDVGFCRKCIIIRACPLGCKPGDICSDISSEYMVERLRIHYNCRIPTLQWNELICLSDQEIFVERAYTYEMVIRNVDNVSGFVFFKFIPSSELGEMFIDGQKKFFIAAESLIKVKYSVVFRKVGPNIRLPGLLGIVGKQVFSPFQIDACVLPPRLTVSPERINNQIAVLATKENQLFIENATPTKAKFRLSLKNEKYQHLEPMGGILGPDGHSVGITLYSKFYDFGIYKNTIYINLDHAGIQEIPITTVVHGIPIFFEPNLKNGFKAETRFTRSDNDNAPACEYSQHVKVTNFGEHSYRLTFNKVKSKSAVLPEFDIKPKMILLEGHAEEFMQITCDATKVTEVYSEFNVAGIDLVDKRNFHFFRFAAEGKFIACQLAWSKREIFLSLINAEDVGERPMESVQLINPTIIDVEGLELKVTGPFLLFNSLKAPVTKQLKVSIAAKSRVDVTILLDGDVLSRQQCECFEGKVCCRINNRNLNPLQLKGIMVNPGLKICTPEVLYFTRNMETYSHIELNNSCLLESFYRWKMVEQMEIINDWHNKPHHKTISERILSLPKDSLPTIPTFLQPIYDEFPDNSASSVSKSSSENLMRQSLTLTQSLSTQKPTISSTKISSEFSLSLPSAENLSSSSNKFTDFPQLLETVWNFFEFEQIKPEEEEEEEEEDENLMTASAPQKQCICFENVCGRVLPKQKICTYMYLPPVPKGLSLRAKFKLDVDGGQSQDFAITLVNFKGNVELSKTDVDLGCQPWYKEFNEKIKINNPTKFTLKVRLIETFHKNNHERLTKGYVEAATAAKIIHMPAESCNIVTFRGIMGLSDRFVDDIGIEVNNGNVVPIRFHGQGQMPMLIVANLKQSFEKEDIEIQYRTLGKIYQDILPELLIGDSDPRAGGDDGNNMSNQQQQPQMPLKTSQTKKRTSKIKAKKTLPSFDIVNADQLPSAIGVERLIETMKFLDKFHSKADIRQTFQKLYCSYAKVEAAQRKINPKSFVVHTMPYELIEYYLDMGDLEIDVLHRYEITIIFHGPGKLILSARTLIAIPEFDASLIIAEDTTGAFFSYKPPESKFEDMTCPLSQCYYRNIYERQEDMQQPFPADPKLCHAHSYDIDKRKMIHRRQVSPRERKRINEYYTSINQLSFKEKKNPFVLSEIYQMGPNVCSATYKVLLSIEIRPNIEHYVVGQLFEDYLFVDVHMGPRLPIVMHGDIIDKIK